jgi:DNA-binding HxlR family transcriptional regulator
MTYRVLMKKYKWLIILQEIAYRFDEIYLKKGKLTKKILTRSLEKLLVLFNL